MTTSILFRTPVLGPTLTQLAPVLVTTDRSLILDVGSVVYNPTGGDGTGEITGTLLQQNVDNDYIFTVNATDLTFAHNGQRVAIKDEDSGGLLYEANGIYIVNITGDQLSLTRSNDFNDINKVPFGAHIPVQIGHTYKGTILGFAGTSLDFNDSSSNITQIGGTGGSNIILIPQITPEAVTLTGLQDLTNKTINGLTPTALPIGFMLAGGGTSRTLIVPTNASVAGTNTGDQTNITGNAATVTTNANLTGDVTSVGNATTITNNIVGNTKLAQMPALTIKGNLSGSTANAADLTQSDMRTFVQAKYYGSQKDTDTIAVNKTYTFATIVNFSGIINYTIVTSDTVVTTGGNPTARWKIGGVDVGTTANTISTSGGVSTQVHTTANAFTSGATLTAVITVPAASSVTGTLYEMSISVT